MLKQTRKIAIRAKGLTVDVNNKYAATFDKMKQLALSVNNIPVKNNGFTVIKPVLQMMMKQMLFNQNLDFHLRLIEFQNKL